MENNPGNHKKIKNAEELLQTQYGKDLDAGMLKEISHHFSISITKEMSELITSPDDPVGMQFIPQKEELNTYKEEMEDHNGDLVTSPVKGIVHRYPNRVLLKPVHICPVYCRFCFRREMIGPGSEFLDKADLEQAIDYIRKHEEIWEVIITGGDPLILAPSKLEPIIAMICDISHVKVLRLHTRIPIVDPARVNDELIRVLKMKKPTYIVIHSNHVQEITDAGRAAIDKLADNGIPLLSHSVLLRGINDTKEALTDLFQALVELRVKPYYLFHGDLVKGTRHFRQTIEKGQQLMAALRGDISGLCQPTFVMDIAGGLGKSPIGPNYVEKTDGGYHIRDYNGEQHFYNEHLPDLEGQVVLATGEESNESDF